MAFLLATLILASHSLLINEIPVGAVVTKNVEDDVIVAYATLYFVAALVCTVIKLFKRINLVT